MSSKSRKKREAHEAKKRDSEDRKLFKVLVMDPYYGPMIRATRSGAVIAYILEEAKIEFKNIRDGGVERNRHGYPYVGGE